MRLCSRSQNVTNYALLRCKIFGLKFGQCNILDKYHFCAIYSLIGRLWAKKCFWVKNSVFWALLYPADTNCGAFSQQIWPRIFPHSLCVKFPVALTVVYIAYYTELDLQICNYAPKRRICRVYSNENFCGHFCSRRKAANFCHSVYKEFQNSPATLRHKPK